MVAVDDEADEEILQVAMVGMDVENLEEEEEEEEEGPVAGTDKTPPHVRRRTGVLCV